MADEKYNFAAARTRLEEIVVQVRKKDTSLEQSLDLLEEGVRLANTCTELSDHTEWRTVIDDPAVQTTGDDASGTATSEEVVQEGSPADAEASAGGSQASEEVDEIADDSIESTDGNTRGE